MAKKPVDQTQSVTTSNLRMEAPKSSRHHKTNVTELLTQDLNPVGGFVKFLRENAVVGLAIGFVVGTQVQVVVKQLITSFIDPTFLLFFGQTLTNRVFVLHFRGRSASYNWGDFAYALLNFFFILLTVYVIIKVLNLDKLDQPKKK